MVEMFDRTSPAANCTWLTPKPSPLEWFTPWMLIVGSRSVASRVARRAVASAAWPKRKATETFTMAWGQLAVTA